MSTSLVNTLNTIIARDLGVTPEKVTLDLIRTWRKSHRCAYLTVHPHGGHVVEGLRVLDPTEEQEALAEADQMGASARQ